MKRAASLVAVLLAVGCSNLPTSFEAQGPSAVAARGALAQNGIRPATQLDAPVRSAADGDSKNGPLNIDRVRIRQGGNGFYALPSGNYSVIQGSPVEVWVEWSSDKPLTDPPRLIVDWSSTEKDNIHCGPCLLTKTYGLAGRYTVTVTLDDRAGGLTKRSFTLNATFSNVPQTKFGAEILSPWSVVMNFSNPTNDGLSVTLSSIGWYRADTGALVGSQPELVNFATFTAAQLPATLIVPGGLSCSVTGGAQGQFRFVVVALSANGARSETPFTSSPFPCT